VLAAVSLVHVSHTHSDVCVHVWLCVCVDHDREPCKNEMRLGGQTREERDHVLDGIYMHDEQDSSNTSNSHTADADATTLGFRRVVVGRCEFDSRQLPTAADE